jgi:hypothetical protein
MSSSGNQDGKANRRSSYRGLCEREPSVPLFSRAWWLDAAAGSEQWDVAMVEREGVIKASMPFVMERRFGLNLIGQPLLTQTLGPWLRPSTAKYANQLAEQKDLLSALIDQLPRFDRFSQNWHHTQTNWLPFFWRGFKQTTRYTYILPDLSNADLIWENLLGNIRREIQKASARYSLRVRNDLDIDAFLNLNEMTFNRQGRELPYPRALVRRLDVECAARNCREILIAEDAEGRHHAGAYLVWDENAAYYLMGGSNPAFRTSGAMSLCLWHAIKRASSVSRTFDFEGSMVEPVERFFRAFGAVQTPYFEISKTASRLLRARRGLMMLVGKS